MMLRFVSMCEDCLRGEGSCATRGCINFGKSGSAVRLCSETEILALDEDYGEPCERDILDALGDLQDAHQKLAGAERDLDQVLSELRSRRKR
jgi:hypothetical protein